MLSYVLFGATAYLALIVIVLGMCATAARADRAVIEDDMPVGELLKMPSPMSTRIPA